MHIRRISTGFDAQIGRFWLSSCIDDNKHITAFGVIGWFAGSLSIWSVKD